VRLDRRPNLRQPEACSARPSPQRNPLNLLSVALVLSDLPVLPPEQGSVHSASSSSSSSSHNNNNSSSSSSSNHNNHSNRPGPDSVRSVKLSHSNRLGLELADSVPRSRSKLAAFSLQVTLPSVKSLPPADSVRVSRFNLAFATNASKEPQPLVLVPLGLAPEPLDRPSPRPPLLLERLPNSPRQVRLVQGDSVLVSPRRTPTYKPNTVILSRKQIDLRTIQYRGVRFYTYRSRDWSIWSTIPTAAASSTDRWALRQYHDRNHWYRPVRSTTAAPTNWP